MLRKDPSHPKKIACCYANDVKAFLPHCPTFERAKGEMLLPCPFPGFPVHIILHALSLLVVVGYHVSL